MKVMIVPIVIDAFGTRTTELLKGLEDMEVGGRVETIQITTLLRTATILRKSWRLEESCCQIPAKNHLLLLMGKTLNK